MVLQVREARLQVLLWQRAKEPFAGAWSLPGGYLEPGETLERSIRRQLAVKVDVRELAWLEQLETRSDPEPPSGRVAARHRLPRAGAGRASTPPCRRTQPGTRSTGCRPRWPSTTSAIVLAGRERLRAKLSYTNIGFALAPERFTISELRDLYSAALGYRVSATNLRRVLERRGAIEPTGERRASGPDGGRPAAVYSFVSRELEVTDPFAVLAAEDSPGRRVATARRCRERIGEGAHPPRPRLAAVAPAVARVVAEGRPLGGAPRGAGVSQTNRQPSRVTATTSSRRSPSTSPTAGAASSQPPVCLGQPAGSLPSSRNACSR